LFIGEWEAGRHFYLRGFDGFHWVLCEPLVLDAEREEAPEIFEFLLRASWGEIPSSAKIASRVGGETTTSVNVASFAENSNAGSRARYFF
jgi:hypothetical protein